MKKTLGWILGILGVLAILLLFTLPLWTGWVWRDNWWGWIANCCGDRYGNWRMHGPGMMWGFMPFGWPGMLFMALIPLGFLALIVVGIVWLVRIASGSISAPAHERTCRNCGTQVQLHWKLCPLCGTSLQ